MGQKVHPYGFRLGITTDHRSQWFSDSSKPGERYSDYVAEDITLRRFLQEKLDRAGVSHMVVRRTRDRVTVDVPVLPLVAREPVLTVFAKKHSR